MQKEELEKGIKEWIEDISKESPSFGGLSVCPFAKKAKITILTKLGIQDLHYIVNMRIIPYGIVMIILIDPSLRKDFFEVKESLKKQALSNNIAFMISDPDNPVIIDGYQTTQKKHLLVLLQNLEELLKRSSELSANTTYYDKWTSKQLDEIVTQR